MSDRATLRAPDRGQDVGLAASYEAVLGAIPYTVRRRVRWGDCDSGGIVYTPNFLDFAVETAESWFEHVTGAHWSRLAADYKLGHPYVNCSLSFERMLACGDEFDMHVEVAELRSSAYVLRITATKRNGDVSFRSDLTAAIIGLETMRAVPIPEPIRARLAAYQESVRAASGHAGRAKASQ